MTCMHVINAIVIEIVLKMLLWDVVKKPCYIGTDFLVHMEIVFKNSIEKITQRSDHYGKIGFKNVLVHE